MAVHFDTRLTELAAWTLRDAAQVYRWCDEETGLSGFNPVLTAWNSGMFSDLDVTAVKSVQAGTREIDVVRRSATIRRLFRLPSRLPAVLLPPPPELGAMARSAPIMIKLVEFARWVARDGRTVAEDGLLPEADASDASQWLGTPAGLLPYLWEYALVTGWLELVDVPNTGRRRLIVGETAYRWADGDDLGGLRVWAVVFAAVLARTLEVFADQAPAAARRLNFQGQGVALAVMLFLARRTGLTVGDASDIVQDGAIGDEPTGSAKKSWDAWVREFGDPARRLIRELVALGALVPPPDQDGILTMSPLAQWALREVLRIDGISIQVIVASGDLTPADLIELTAGLSAAEFNAEFEAWSGRRPVGQPARDLLIYAASADPRTRITAVSLARRLGPAAADAWLAAMESPQLRGYAQLALSAVAAELPVAMLPALNDPDPDSFAWVASDLFFVIGSADDPDPGRVAAWFADAIPAGQEGWALLQLARGTYPGARSLLGLLGRYHPDHSIAKDARKAARAAAKNLPATRKPRYPKGKRMRSLDVTRQDRLAI